MRRRLAALLLVMAVVVAVPTAPAGAQAQTFDELRAEFGYTEGHAAVMRLYRAFFEREPDVGGAEYWLLQYDLGSTLDDIAWSFAASAEFTARYGANLDNAQFLSIVYGNVLGRTPDQAGFDYWLAEMNGGLARPEVVRWVTANAEFIQRFPYSPTADWFSMLLSADDIGSGWVATLAATSMYFPPPDGCDRIISTDGRSLVTEFVASSNQHRIVHYVSDLGSVGAAEGFVDRLLAGPAQCSTMTDMFGRVFDIRSANRTDIADGGMRWVGNIPLAGGASAPGYLTAFRSGTYVSVVIHFGVGGPASQDADFVVRQAEAAVVGGPS